MMRAVSRNVLSVNTGPKHYSGCDNNIAKRSMYRHTHTLSLSLSLSLPPDNSTARAIGLTLNYRAINCHNGELRQKVKLSSWLYGFDKLTTAQNSNIHHARVIKEPKGTPA